MKILTIETGRAPCVVRVVLGLTAAERRRFRPALVTEHLVAYGVVLIPERGGADAPRRFEWRTQVGKLPRSMAQQLARVADEFLDVALTMDPEDEAGELARVFRTGRLPVPAPGRGKDPRKWDEADIEHVAAVGSGFLRSCLLDREEAYRSVSGEAAPERGHLRLVK